MPLAGNNIMPNAFLRAAFVFFIVILPGCATGRTDNPGGGGKVSSAAHTIVLARGQKTVIAGESLTVELTEINDSRCPAKVTCIWAGHATVTLQVSKPGSATGRVVIGTEAPASMGLPADANYDGYSFHLLELERGNADGSIQPVPAQRATIRLSRPQSP
jgi:hypothetical protein